MVEDEDKEAAFGAERDAQTPSKRPDSAAVWELVERPKHMRLAGGSGRLLTNSSSLSSSAAQTVGSLGLKTTDLAGLGLGFAGAGGQAFLAFLAGGGVAGAASSTTSSTLGRLEEGPGAVEMKALLRKAASRSARSIVPLASKRTRLTEAIVEMLKKYSTKIADEKECTFQSKVACLFNFYGVKKNG